MERKGKRGMSHRLIVGIAFALGLTAHELSAAELETPEAMRTAIETAMAPRLAGIRDAAVEVEIGAIDSRLKLPACPAIEVTLPPMNAAAMTAKVGCFAPSWTVYVPIRFACLGRRSRGIG
jgi:FlgA N-terminal domain